VPHPVKQGTRVIPSHPRRFLSSGASPQLLAGDACALSEGPELRPGDRRHHGGRPGEGREAAVDAFDDVLAPHQLGIAYDALGDELRVLDEVGGRVDDARVVLRDTDEEVPYLLDPIVEADCALLSFNQLGEAIPAPGADDWSTKRVTTSVERYNRNFDKLALQRKTIWETCTTALHEIQHLMQEQAKSPGAAKKARIEEKMKQLAALARRESVCSSAAIACLQKSEIGWAVRLSAEAP
jgi:hypothetical protein